MGFLEALKQIINIDLDLSNFINIKIIRNSQNNQKFIPSRDAKTLSINYPQLEGKEKQAVNKALKDGFESGEIDHFMESFSEKKVEDIKEKLNLKNTKEILEFYKDKIPLNYYRALEASLYARTNFSAGRSIAEDKRDIKNKFGEEGNNICNLCTAGYFEGYIKEAYEEMESSNNFSIDEWQKYFKLIVRTSPFAVFVYRDMSEEELSGIIMYRLDTNIKYGIKFVDIHGIGWDNVKKIKNILRELQKERDLDPEIQSPSKMIIHVRISIDDK
ncbi:hypothetical protein J4458_03520 [Candidatus Woesearchaeota archaeon]|nr:hypothetical protein [Candidatus Woesearchaeota archaeon]